MSSVPLKLHGKPAAGRSFIAAKPGRKGVEAVLNCGIKARFGDLEGEALGMLYIKTELMQPSHDG
jgi:hypothetical protein